MDKHTTWTTLPDTGARMLLDERGVPRLLLLRETDNYSDVDLEVEVRTGWRIEAKSLTSSNDPRGWLRVVEWAGRLAEPCSYAELKMAPVFEYGGGREPEINACKLTGMAGVSIIHQLKDEWRGHRRGTYLAWASHPGVAGFIVRVGMESTLARLALASLPRVENDSEAGG